MGMDSNGNEHGQSRRSQAIVLVIMLGLVSLLADVATEGTRSIMGPYWCCWERAPPQWA